MARHIADDLWQLDIPLVGNPLKNLNSYLIKGKADERSLLIDTGFREVPCREAMERQLDELAVDRSKLDIFVTHCHSDHSGLASELIQPGGQIFTGRLDGAIIEEILSEEHWRQVYAMHLRNGFRQEEIDELWSKNPAKEKAPEQWGQFCYLDDGAELHYGGHTLRCILTPGHTPGHMCLYEPELQWLFSGDHVLFHISPNICRWLQMKDALGSYLESLRMVRNLPVKLLLPAHRADTGELAPRVDELIAHHDRRIEEAFCTVQEGPGLTAYEIAGRMRWRIRSRSWEEFPLTQKYFAVGETLAHLDYLELRGRVTHRMENEKYRYYVAE